ncbi:hypothetical protein PoB_006689000 [Plakobranchus ocellatus]|uniref:Uncharacterized protein n=1 Tax=Plakobranchus ocellatus TaxID=259542 RepID=A0AAV4D8K4_9GAST|nr:hypothetical protein PoB_006689000 [Plakobranchus ocellatus]
MSEGFFRLICTCSFIPLTTYAFTPNHFVDLHVKWKLPVVYSSFISTDDNNDDCSASATVAVVSNDDDGDYMAVVAGVSDADTNDYEADDYDDNAGADNKDDNFVSTARDILPDGKSPRYGRFLENEKIIQILHRTSVNDTLSEVPRSRKDNVYFAAHTEHNKDRSALYKIDPKSGTAKKHGSLAQARSRAILCDKANIVFR